LIESRGVEARVRCLPFDMFARDWPRGADAVWFSDIFHDWPEARCAWLAERAFDSVAPGGRVFVNEVLLDDDRLGPAAATSYELAMLLATEAGRQYTFGDLRRVLEAAGFDQVHIASGTRVYTLVAATKPAPAPLPSP
jgi:acetylserotonin N-methyltransferase